MRASQAALLRGGVLWGAALDASLRLIWYMKYGDLSLHFNLVPFACTAGPAAFGLCFWGDRQLNWYRRSLFFPWGVVWSLLVLANMKWNWPDEVWTLVGSAPCLLLGAAAVWLVGALWIWWSNGQRCMREGER